MLPHWNPHGHACPQLQVYCVAPLIVTVLEFAHGGVLGKRPFGASAHAGSTAASLDPASEPDDASDLHSGTVRQFLNEQPFVHPATVGSNVDDSHPAASPALLQSASV